MDTLTDQLHGYIHHPDFKNKILEKVATSWRPKIGFDVNAHIETETKKWQELYVNQLYQDIFVKYLNDKLKTISCKLAQNLMRGFQMPNDPDEQIRHGIIQTTVSAVGLFAIKAAFFNPTLAVGIAISGVIFAGLLNFGYINDFNTVREHAVDVRIETLTRHQIRKQITKSYTSAIKTNMTKSLKTLECEIEKLKEEKKKKETENTINVSRMNIFMALNEMVFKCKQHLRNIDE